MKNFLFVINLLIVNLFCYCQNSGFIEYTYIKNLGIEYQTIGLLKFNSQYSSFIELSPQNFEKSEKTLENSVTLSSVSKDRPKVIFNREKDTLFSKILLFRKNYKIKEKTPKIKWKIKDDFKKINDFKCQYAEGYFRGRIYKVWFTTDIPLPYGPWKLQGLPGLIFLASDNKNQIIFSIKSIKLDKQIKINDNEFKNAIELKKFVENKQKLFEEKEKSLSSKVPRNATVKLNLPTRKTQKEIVYEWEEKTIEN